MAAYYNEFEPYAAEWLRNLIKAGYIPDGEVDTRSIVDVAPDDLRGFTQCHFFAGIGGWGHALRLAGWPDDRPIWTGSCPCQPFSVAGKGAGTADPRHLWPHFHRLIAACRPPVVMGEQVAGKAGYGWFDGVRADLEGSGYSSRAADIPALAVNAPHIRQRLYWVAVANATDGGRQFVEDERSASVQPMVAGPGKGGEQSGDLRAGILRDLANADEGGRGRRPRNGDGERDGQAGERNEDHRVVAGGGEDRLDVADADSCGSFTQSNRNNRKVDGTVSGEKSAGDQSTICSTACSTNSSFWSDHVWLTGSDGKSRRVEPSIPLLAYGIPNRVGRLRAYGNAIVPQVAAEVIAAYMESV